MKPQPVPDFPPCSDDSRDYHTQRTKRRSATLIAVASWANDSNDRAWFYGYGTASAVAGAVTETVFGR
jgi:hypothetical protein